LYNLTTLFQQSQQRVNGVFLWLTVCEMYCMMPNQPLPLNQLCEHVRRVTPTVAARLHYYGNSEEGFFSIGMRSQLVLTIAVGAGGRVTFNWHAKLKPIGADNCCWCRWLQGKCPTSHAVVCCLCRKS